MELLCKSEAIRGKYSKSHLILYNNDVLDIKKVVFLFAFQKNNVNLPPK